MNIIYHIIYIYKVKPHLWFLVILTYNITTNYSYYL